jgi:hypothetical protein
MEMKMEMVEDEVCGSQAGRQKEIEGRVRGQKEIDCEQFKRQKKTLHGRFFQDPRTREGKDKSSKIEAKKKRKDKKSAASEPQRREDKRPGGAAALANQRLSFERPCDQLIRHADLVIRPASKSLSSIFFCTVLIVWLCNCSAFQLFTACGLLVMPRLSTFSTISRLGHIWCLRWRCSNFKEIHY